MSIHTRKITDSCRDKDCIEDLRVYLTTGSQSQLDTTRKELRTARENVTAANNMIAGYTLRQNTRTKRRDELAQKLRESTAKLDSVSAKTRVFRAMERDFDSYNKAVKMVMQESQRGALWNIHGPVSG